MIASILPIKYAENMEGLVAKEMVPHTFFYAIVLPEFNLVALILKV